MFTASVYRWLTRALFLCGVTLWAVARTAVADGLFARWALAGGVLAGAALLALLVGAGSRVSAQRTAVALVASALLSGLAAGVVWVATVRLNLAYACFVLACVYALLALARGRGLLPQRGWVDAVASGAIGLLCGAALQVGGVSDLAVSHAATGATLFNSATLAVCGPRLLRMEARGEPAVRAALLPWGLLLAGLAVASCVTAWRADTVSSVEVQATPNRAALRARLTPEQYRVTQEGSTEQPFANAYWDNHAAGIYVDLVSGEPLFSSVDKYDSGTGWPSFTRPWGDALERRTDFGLGVPRTEVRSKEGHAHLGHVFDDGPAPTGERYCINSAAVRFVPLAEMRGAGYGAALFAFAAAQGWQVATLAGGCFWGLEDVFARHAGVVATQVGYAGGQADQATYAQVATGATGHAEALQVLFDPTQVSYEQLLLFFFRVHDPTTGDRQGNDVGSQYRSAIFTADAEQARVAASVMQRVEASKQWRSPLTTQRVPLGGFWRAEAEHQGYLAQHPNAYTCHHERDMAFDAP